MQPKQRVFLLSPANSAGDRIRLLLRPSAAFALALQLRSSQGAPLGDVFSFASGLYFRGKLAYARAFGCATAGRPASFVIIPGFGLVDPDKLVRVSEIKAFGEVPVDLRNNEYRRSLEDAAQSLNKSLKPSDEIVLLGSIASGKYTTILVEIFGPRLLFPIDFVGRGDMSRGGLLLRSVQAKTELPYRTVLNSVLHGPRPPKLPRTRSMTLADDPGGTS